MVRKLYLHAGAHRTGTSSFQLCLAANRQQLESEGYDLAYPGRDGAPEGHLHLRLPKPSHGEDQHGAFVGKVTRALKKHVSGEDQPLVLSEENLLGLTFIAFLGVSTLHGESGYVCFATGLKRWARRRSISC